MNGTPKVALQAAGGSAGPPVVPAYVDDLSVLTSGTLTVTAPGGPIFTGTTGQADVTVTNGGDRPAST